MLDGVGLAERALARLRCRIARAGSPPLRLAVVSQADPESVRSVGYKQRAAERVGMTILKVAFPPTAGIREVAAVIGGLNADPAVHGIFIQLPLPHRLDVASVMDLIDPDKDVDGLGSHNRATLAAGDATGHAPCTALAVMCLLRHYSIPTKGARAVVLGASSYAGQPLVQLLAQAGVVVTTLSFDSGDTGEIRARCRDADIVASEARRPGLITADWVRPGATVVDIGASRVDGVLRGDLDLESVRRVAGAVVPNPGGVGPVTVACLLRATVRAAQWAGAFPADG